MIKLLPALYQSINILVIHIAFNIEITIAKDLTDWKNNEIKCTC